MNNENTNHSLMTSNVKAWLLLPALGLLQALLNMEFTAVNLILVPIAQEMEVELKISQWLLSGYSLVWGAFLIPAGRLTDLYGNRSTLIGGLFLFIMGSYVAGAGNVISLLIAGRILQGLGGALFTAPALTSIYTSMPVDKRGFAMGVVVSCGIVGETIGPTFAGFLIDEINWRWIFYINIPLGILILLLLMFALKKKVILSQQPFNFMTASLLSLGLCITIWALSQLSAWEIMDVHFIGSILLGGALIVAYIALERGSSYPLISPCLFRNKAYMGVTLGGCFMAMAFLLMILMIRIYLQTILNYPSYRVGLVFLFLTIPIAILSLISGKITDKIGSLPPMIFGCLVISLSLGLMAFLGNTAPFYHISIALFLGGLGIGAFGPACYMAMMKTLEQKDLNVGTSVYTMASMIGTSLSTVLAIHLFVSHSKKYFFNQCSELAILLTPQQQEELTQLIAKVEPIRSHFQFILPEQIDQITSLIKDSFINGFFLNIMVGILFSFLAGGVILWGGSGLKRKEEVIKTAPAEASPI